MPSSAFSNETVLIFLQMLKEKADALFSRVNNKLTVNNKSTMWKQLCDDLKVTTGQEDIQVDKLIKNGIT